MHLDLDGPERPAGLGRDLTQREVGEVAIEDDLLIGRMELCDRSSNCQPVLMRDDLAFDIDGVPQRTRHRFVQVRATLRVTLSSRRYTLWGT